MRSNVASNQSRRGLQTVVRWLILIHRYLGIPLSALFVVWFASGIVMMYTGDMPRLTPELRLERLPALDFDRIVLAPAAAARQAYLSPTPQRASLLTVMDRPAYRFDGVTVFADTGERLGEVGPTAAAAVASRFTGRPPGAVEYAGTLAEPDQWTLVERRQLPLHKLAIDDDAGTELYVSPRTAEVAMLTTRRSRALAWMGAIPHWIYFTALRTNQPLWYDIVVWTSTLGCLLAVIGLVLGVTQFRWRQPRGDNRSTGGIRSRIPYAGWMRWHYLTGVVFGLVTLTWVFSGLLSMDPYAWNNASGLDVPRHALSGGPLDLASFAAVDGGAWERVAGGQPVKEIELLRIQDDPYYAVRVGAGPEETAGVSPERRANVDGGSGPSGPLLVAADTLVLREEPFSTESLLKRLTAAVPGVPVVESELLADYDAYYYARGYSRDRQAPLPVMRVKFGDPMETWVYVDPVLGRVVAREHRFTRVERWLFNGLHSLDFAFWYDRRPLWDIGVIALSLGGLASSGIGLWIGCGRIRRALGRGLSRTSAVRRPRSG
ncbi:MAG: hypothetical protein F4137_03530 [Acidobacteria bacterium]|nr:hypothetical protein [Acidobacteriota bacterium]MYH27930.1 hypothetical protein [Acidobacteriota bacterium]